MNTDDLAAKSSGRIHRTVNYRVGPRRITAAIIDGDLLIAFDTFVS